MPRNPARSSSSRRRDTVEQLRRDIDRGATHDKVRGADPAAAPLGADEEAAGSPPDPRRVDESRARELGTRAGSPSAPAHLPPGQRISWVWLAVPGAAAVLILAIWLVQHF